MFVWLPSCHLSPGSHVCVRNEAEVWIISNPSLLANKVGKARIGNMILLLCRIHQLIPTFLADELLYHWVDAFYHVKEREARQVSSVLR